MMKKMSGAERARHISPRHIMSAAARAIACAMCRVVARVLIDYFAETEQSRASGAAKPNHAAVPPAVVTVGPRRAPNE